MAQSRFSLAQPSKSKEFLLVSWIGELESCFSKEGAKMGAYLALGLGSEPCAGRLQVPAGVLLWLLSFLGNGKKKISIFLIGISGESLLFLADIMLWRMPSEDKRCMWRQEASWV